MSRSPLKHFYTAVIWLCLLCAIHVMIVLKMYQKKMIMLKMFCTVLKIALFMHVCGDPWGTIVLLSSMSYTLTCGLKTIFVSRTLLFAWRASSVFGKHRMWCVLVISRLDIIDYNTLLGAILVLSWCPWVAVFFLVRNNVGHLGTLPVWELRFSMLMGAVLVVPVA